MKSSATKTICAIAGCIAIAIFASARAEAKVFRWSFQGDVLSLDPQDRRDTFSRDFVGNIMEPLVKFNETWRSSRRWRSGGRFWIRRSGGFICARA